MPVVDGVIGRTGMLPSTVDEAIAVLESRFAEHPFRAPEAGELTGLGLGTRELAAAVRVGRLAAVTDSVFLGPGYQERALSILAGLEQPFTVSQARRALDTTRRVAVPLLEHLDRAGRTRTLTDGRHAIVLGS